MNDLRAGVKLPPPKQGEASQRTIEHAERDYRKGQRAEGGKTNPRRSRAVTKALQREGKSAASKQQLSQQAKRAARRRSPEERSESARQAAKTRLAHQSPAERSAIARKAARTRKAKAE